MTEGHGLGDGAAAGLSAGLAGRGLPGLPGGRLLSASDCQCLGPTRSLKAATTRRDSSHDLWSAPYPPDLARDRTEVTGRRVEVAGRNPQDCWHDEDSLTFDQEWRTFDREWD